MTADPLALHEHPLDVEDRPVVAPGRPVPWALDHKLARKLAAYVVASPGAEQVPIHTPLTGAVVAELPRSTPADVERAFAIARAAQKQWAKRSARERAKVFKRVAKIVLARQDEGLDIIQLENGKARIHAFDEISDAAINAAWCARKGPGILGESRHVGLVPILTKVREVHHPKGVVGMISPWNYPLVLTISDAVPALLAGNAVVLKPDSQTPFTALWAADVLAEAGLPEGLFTIVYGQGRIVGTEIINRADHVCFTGSTATGTRVAQQAAARLVSSSLELGGKNPVYVADDANLNRAAEGIIRDTFSNSGHACVSMERLYVHDKIAEKFLDTFLTKVKEMKLGSGLDYNSDFGSIASQSQLDLVEAHVNDAIEKGAIVLAGGKARPDIGPLFYEPTVLANVPETATCFAEETFGPVLSVYRVASDQEAIDACNDTDYGLNASVWATRRRGARIARGIEAGTVVVNEAYTVGWASVASPMGGRKQSGMGRRHGSAGILRFTESQSVAVQAVGLRVLLFRGGDFYSKAFTFLLRLSRATRFPWP
ncbi:succinic semialdehyde dehydrogenase [Spongisporangium articulatum]|uniref:Succinic semialdehyde dehydrogenase n=1 Tax=Spongisporangium articulatum TaxID=3362603 RepID=A0ABW8APB0_9ACTN